MLGSFPVLRLDLALDEIVAGPGQINPAETVLFSPYPRKARHCGKITV